MTGTSATRPFQVLAEQVSEMVWIMSVDGAWEYANQRWCGYTGLSVEASAGLGWRQALHEEDLPAVLARWHSGSRAGNAFEAEYRLLGSDGLYRWFLVHAEPLDDSRWIATAVESGPTRSDGAPSAAEASVGHAVAAEPQAGDQDPPTAAAIERNLRETEGRWKFALEAADLGAWELDLATGKATRSLRHDQIFGYPTLLPEWNYTYFLQHVVPDDRDRVERSFRRALAERKDWLSECRISRADGEQRWIRVTGRAVRGAGGRPVRMWGIVEDTTERKLAEQALRDREAHFRSLANTVPAMLWVTNVDHVCTFISRGWCSFTGQAMANALGEGRTRSIHPADRERVERIFLEAARRRQPFQLEYRLCTAAGDYRWVLDSGRPRSTSEGDFLGYVGSVTDVHAVKAAREEQQRANELLHAVIDTTQDGVFVKDLRGRMRLANPAALRAIGRPADEVIGHCTLEWMENAEEAMIVDANDLRVMESGRAEVVEEAMSSKEGYRLFLATKSPLRNEAGDVVGLVGISREVTEQKRAEQRVLESESRMRRLFDNAPANIAIFEGPEHRCIYLNYAHIKFFGERRCLGMTVREAFPEFDENSEIKRLDQVFQTGDPLVTPHVEATYEGAGSGLPNGIFHETIQPWFHEDGSVAGVMVMAFDITAEVELRREVEESGARFRALADNIAQLAWMADERGRIFWYNRRWLDYTGTTFRDMQNSRWQNVHHPDHAQRVMKKVSRCLRSGEVLEDTFPLRGGDGKYRWFYSQAIPIRDENGKVIRWFGTHTDVTEQREAARALEEADRRKNEFLAMLAHELRNPLAPVHYAVEILRNIGTEDEGQIRARDMIDRQVSHMARLIDDLLDVSRITRGKIELRKERCDLTGIVEKTVGEYRLGLEASDITLASDLPDHPLWVEGDPTRLIQAIGNLLHNAGKFTEAGGRVSVRLQLADSEEAAVLTVSDNGVGIDGRLLSQLFEPFSQAAQTLDRSKGGLGLGLSLVKGLVELHGGTVMAASEGAGRGSTFTLRFPLAARVHQVAEPPRRFQHGAALQAQELRVLIIEDNRDTAESLGTLLQMAGHQVEMAFDGPSGIELARHSAPDVVLCDLGLPGGMDGYQVVRRLRQQDATSDARLFALSGYGQEADRRRAREAGFDRHFVKPVNFAELTSALGEPEYHSARESQC